MDFNDFRAVLTPLVGIILFLCVVKWAYGRKSKQVYDEAANLPFTEDDDSESGETPAPVDQRKML
ncbi:MAG: cbb3-type cytochrome c oxidase subunit 3 [Zoogloeaceae bacterium]|jgi:cytochrome c oxidase cbb3-type subunit 4|nr:cbb3-type cytochrome c oxidase subunit 3 [Zoogloeaceae bacterium]